MIYKLVKPVTKVNGETITEVTVKEEYTGRDNKAVGNCKGNGDAEIALVVCATGLSENTVLNMSSRDVNAIAEVAANFLANGGV